MAVVVCSSIYWFKLPNRDWLSFRLSLHSRYGIDCGNREIYMGWQSTDNCRQQYMNLMLVFSFAFPEFKLFSQLISWLLQLSIPLWPATVTISQKQIKPLTVVDVARVRRPRDSVERTHIPDVSAEQDVDAEDATIPSCRDSNIYIRHILASRKRELNNPNRLK